MHFIQNSWFTHNWIFLLLFLIGSVSVIAYINNRKKLLKYASASFSILFLFGICFLVLPQINHSMTLSDDIVTSIPVGKSSEERMNIFSKFINFIIRILKDKLND